MKNIIYYCILAFTIASSVNAQHVDENLNSTSIEGRRNSCQINSDDLYNRQQVFKQLADILNNSIPEYKQRLGFEFSVENEVPVGFGIYDLTDTSNKFQDEKDCINFIDGHIYNVSPFFHPFSFNHIIILEVGVLKTFESINCLDRGSKIEEVVDYINLKIPDNNSDKETILKRVKNYRKFGEYARTDPQSRILCKVIKL